MIGNFNQLSPSEDERLTIVAEECSEIIKAICKIQRHGYASIDPTAKPDSPYFGEDNRAMLSREIGDLFHALERMSNAGDISLGSIRIKAKYRGRNRKFYLHHQEGQ